MFSYSLFLKLMLHRIGSVGVYEGILSLSPADWAETNAGDVALCFLHTIYSIRFDILFRHFHNL